MTLVAPNGARDGDMRHLAGATGRVPMLTDIDHFGDDPGNLRMRLFEPSVRAKTCPLVVVLHGCTQTAAGFDSASGWSALAQQHGFLVLYPEQRASNNEKTCFSWFQADDVARGRGEVASIRQMIAWTIANRSVDPREVFICGLSAGGAMAVAMLAAYPEVFSGGAIIAGLPYGSASSVSGALDAMLIGRTKDASKWGDFVRAASDHVGRWPRISIWYGASDRVVKPINAGELEKQWTNLQGVGAEAPTEESIGPAVRRIWRDANGFECVTSYMVPGLGHGVPVDMLDPPAPFFIPAGISATKQIAEDFGLLARRRPLAAFRSRLRFKA